MTDNNPSSSDLGAAQQAAAGSLQTKDTQPQQQLLTQGRRVTIGGMNRRSSLGMAEAALGDLFGRRASGFGELDVLGRRGSLDSTSAVLDAAIMDLTRRRLSVAMGTMPGETMQDPLTTMTGSMGGAFSGMDSMGGALAGMNAVNTMNAMGAAAAAGQLSSQAASAAAPSLMPANRESGSVLNNRQQQLQEQQRELERRQKELEVQRQQLVTAMEERRRVMQQMQQKLGQAPPNQAVAAAAAATAATHTQLQRTSLLGSLGGGLAGGNTQGLLMGLQNRGLAATAAQQTNTNSSGGSQQWFVCKICNSKAFSNIEEAAQHEAICLLDKGRRASLGGGAPLMGGLDRQEIVRQAVNQQNMQQARRDSDLALARRFSLTGDSASHGGDQMPTTMSNGPFAMMEQPIPLAMNPDKDWLTPLHCFVRRHCVQVFTATERDVATPSKGKRKPIQVGQVGIRCPHCHNDQDESARARERGSVYYPTSIASIYNATMNLLQRHLHNCTSVPPEIMRRYETLKADDARSGTSKKYWVESALSLGLVDTANGIKFSALTPPPLPGLSRQQHSTGTYSTARRNSNDFFSTNSNAISDLSQRSNSGAVPAAAATAAENPAGDSAVEGDAQKNESEIKREEGPSSSNEAVASGTIPQTEQAISQSAPLVTPEDEPYATGFSYHLLSQMQPCVFTEADRLGKRKGLPPGFPGLACRHCFGGYGSGRFFPSSIKTLSDTSKTLNVLHNHMMRCRKCPPEVRETLDKLRKSHDEQRAKMKFGSQKAFFARIWDRLHYKDPNVSSKRKFQPTMPAAAPSGFLPQGSVLESTLPQSAAFDAALAMQYGDLLNKRQKMS